MAGEMALRSWSDEGFKDEPVDVSLKGRAVAPKHKHAIAVHDAVLQPAPDTDGGGDFSVAGIEPRSDVSKVRHLVSWKANNTAPSLSMHGSHYTTVTGISHVS